MGNSDELEGRAEGPVNVSCDGSCDGSDSQPASRSDLPWRVMRMPVADALVELAGEGLGFDAVLSDPPYGLKFMGQGWDYGVPDKSVWEGVLQLLRPGASAVLFGGTRTYHRLVSAAEDAGFEVRDSLSIDTYRDTSHDEGHLRWYYGSGWPKPANVSKFIDKKLGVKRDVVGTNPNARESRAGTAHQSTGRQTTGSDITAPSSDDAARFDGWHANLAPAWEPAVLLRKPLDGTLAGNALQHGLAGLNVDGCRVSATKRVPSSPSKPRPSPLIYGTQGNRGGTSGYDPKIGRWPANVILMCDEQLCGPGDPRRIEHAPGCHVSVVDGQSGESQSAGPPSKLSTSRKRQMTGFKMTAGTTGYKDSGGASRYFYTAKVSRSERGSSAHPCMKPLALTTYIAKLLLPPPRKDGLPRRILVPFSGSGSEMIGALAAGWDEVIGIEYDASCNNPGQRPDYWADTAEERLHSFATTFTKELELADILAEQGFLTSRDFTTRGLKSADWVKAGYVTRDEEKRTKLLPGKQVFARYHSESRLEWYRQTTGSIS